MNQLADEEEANILKEYILSVPRKKKETVFGIFIGYSIDYKGDSDTSDEYDKKVIDENINQVLAYKAKIIEYINQYNISNYEFNFYFLPFHKAMRDRKTIIESLTSGSPHLKWGSFRPALHQGRGGGFNICARRGRTREVRSRRRVYLLRSYRPLCLGSSRFHLGNYR